MARREEIGWKHCTTWMMNSSLLSKKLFVGFFTFFTWNRLENRFHVKKNKIEHIASCLIFLLSAYIYEIFKGKY
jgi:hypothetical protein